MRARAPRPLTALAAAGIATLALSVATGTAGSADPSDHGGHNGPLTVTTILSGNSLSHSFTPADATSPQTEPLSKPDDITRLGDDIFVGFQNGVGPQGEASTSGNQDSTVVEMTMGGQPVAQWDIAGKTDGVTADPEANDVIATVNEDNNSSLYTIAPGAGGAVQHYEYNEPLPHGGGTDAISVLGDQLLVSASAPGTTGQPAPQPTYPAVYSVTLDPTTSVATVHTVFSDEDSAVVANVGTAQTGQSVALALTDPDSNEVVPSWAPRFQGDFMLTSQGDLEQIFVHEDRWGSGTTLSVLSLSQSVDDTAWPTDGRGTLFATDSTNDTVDAVTGPFPDGPVVVATPCGSNSAPATCPAPPTFPANYLGSLNPWTGQVTALAVQGVPMVPQGGLLFVGDRDRGRGRR
jgi:hypothetical protein